MFGYRKADTDPSTCIGEFGEGRTLRIFLAPAEGSSCHCLRIDAGERNIKVLLPITNPKSTLPDLAASLSELLNSPAELRVALEWFTNMACFFMGRRIIATSKEVMCVVNSLMAQNTARYGNGCRFIHLAGWSREKIVLESFSRGNQGTSPQFLSLTRSEAEKLLRILEEAHNNLHI